MNQLTLAELQEWRESGKIFQLIDVREPEEHQAFNIGGDLIPLGSILQALPRISREHPVVVYCKRGIRSQIAIQRLQNRLPDAVFYNLLGGIISLQ